MTYLTARTCKRNFHSLSCSIPGRVWCKKGGSIRSCNLSSENFLLCNPLSAHAWHWAQPPRDHRHLQQPWCRKIDRSISLSKQDFWIGTVVETLLQINVWKLYTQRTESIHDGPLLLLELGSCSEGHRVCQQHCLHGLCSDTMRSNPFPYPQQHLNFLIHI